MAEIEYRFKDIFVSITDKFGVIEYCNLVFEKLSGYQSEELIGSAHNIIRHPEMPRAVFKVFWDILKDNRPVFAFVNNKSKNGDNYWVFACVVPGSQKNYISIRLKPDSKYFPIAQELYKNVMKFEKAHGMDKAVIFLHDELKKLGFDSYEAFMSNALIAELSADRYLEILPLEMPLKNDSLAKDKYRNLITIQSHARVIMNELVTSFNRLNVFSSQIEIINQAKIEIQKSTRGLDFLSCNMSITAHKLGKDGQGLSIVAQTFQRKINELTEKKKAISESIEKYSRDASDCLVFTGLALVEVMMLKSLSLEVLHRMLDEQSMSEDQKTSEMKVLSELLESTTKYFEESKNKMSQIISSTNILRKAVLNSKSSFVAINIVSQGGRLEGAKSFQLEKAFNYFLIEITRFLDEGEKPFNEINTQLLEMQLTLEFLEKILSQNSSVLQNLKNEIFRMSYGEQAA